MTRNKKGLLGLTAAGLVLVFATVLGVFAPNPDTADTRDLSVEQGAQLEAIDLKISDSMAPSAQSALSCNDPAITYVDNQVGTAIIALTPNANPPIDSSNGGFICLKNTGTAAATITNSFVNVTNLETGCTGNEGSFDATCGGGLAGEIADDVTALIGLNRSVTPHLCNSTPTAETIGGIVTRGPFAFTVPLVIAPGASQCVSLDVRYGPTFSPGGLTATEAQENQTDKVTWRWRFGAAT